MIASRSIVNFLVVMAVVFLSGSAFGQTEGERVCQLGSENSLFAPQSWPNKEVEPFARGKLGILDPRYDHFYLFIAYRQLAGKSITSMDVEHLRQFDPCWDDGTRGYHGSDGHASAAMVASRKAWDAARSQDSLPLPSAGSTARGRSALGYVDYYIPNCNSDAFLTAARTLSARLSAHGANAWVRRWALGQDMVFRQCFEVSSAFPDAAPPDAPPWYRADRQYQIAAAHFYAGNYPKAAELFEAIGRDTASQWQPLGSYLAARAWIRHASASQGQSDSSNALLKAQNILTGALSASGSLPLRADVERMLQRVRLRTEPDLVFAELDARLSATALSAGIGQDLRDFDPGRAKAATLDLRDPGFATWLDAFRRGTAEAVDKIGAAAPASELWLVAMLQSALPGSANLAPLLDRAAEVPTSSPAYFTTQYHRVRLLGDRGQAMRLARQLLALPDDEFTVQDKNRIKALALRSARTSVEFAKLAYRAPIDLASLQMQNLLSEKLPVVDDDGAALLNGSLPLDRLQALYESESAETPVPLRNELRSVVWTRALVLGRWDVLRKMRPDMQKLVPGAATLLRQIDAATDPREKRALGALFLARYPGLVGSVNSKISHLGAAPLSEIAQPNMHRFYLQDGNRENWWCSLPSGRYWVSDSIPEPPAPPAFLTLAEQRRWREEYKVLAATPDATTYLGTIVLDWAKAHPRDPFLPDALRMIVRSARGGCIGPETGELGRRAFQHLHHYFPSTEAARLTRSHG